MSYLKHIFPFSKKRTPKPIDAEQLLQHSKVFCMAPWVHLHVLPDGLVYPCCMAANQEQNAVGSLLRNADIAHAWNSPKLKALRTDMLEGRTSEVCRNCYAYEQAGKQSERIQFNTDYRHHMGRVYCTISDGHLPEVVIPYLDIRFSNKCNLKCRICNASASSSWREDAVKLGAVSESFPDVLYAADNQELFWRTFAGLLPQVEKIHFAGGEPLLMKEHYKTLEYLIAIGKTNVRISYNTNLSTLRYRQHRVTELWKKFNHVAVFASLDDMGARGDYQRKGQVWGKVVQNIRTLQAEAPDIYFGIDITVSIFNVLRVPEFYKYMVDQGLVQPDRVNLYLLFDPHEQSIRNLPLAMKQTVVQLYDEFDINYLATLPGSVRIREHSRAVVRHLLAEDYHLQKEFARTVKAVDALRKENFETTFPELAGLLQV